MSEEVQIALINFEYHKIVGDAIHECKDLICDPEGYGLPTNCTEEQWEVCKTAPPVYFDPNARCDTTRELAELAYQAGKAGRHNGFRPARSHFSLRTMQQTAGFLTQNDRGKACSAERHYYLLTIVPFFSFSFSYFLTDFLFSTGDWQCSRAATLYDGIICPEGHYKVKETDFDQQCDSIGLPCPDGHKCYCKPCIKAFEVDVVQLDDDEENSLLTSGDELHRSGCNKMALCGSVKQTKIVKFRAFDNREREGAKVTAVMHVGQTSIPLPVSRTENQSFAYDFTFSDKNLGVGILEVAVNGEKIPESPFRVEVLPRDCGQDYPGEGKTAVRMIVVANARVRIYGCLALTYNSLVHCLLTS